MNHDELNKLVALSVSGDQHALERVLLEIQDFVFNISLRMLGTLADAEDATQEIILRVMMKLSTFQGHSSFKTWVYRLSCNFLIDYKKSMFAQHPLDFEFYANDITYGFVDASEDLQMGVSKEKLEHELKLSCTNVLLQCLDPQSRCIFILGTMFRADSKLAGEILEITPENYRQKLSRARKKVRDFLTEYCGLSATGCCCCEKRVHYAISQHRIDPKNLEFSGLKVLDTNILESYKEMMETIDDETLVFHELPNYKNSVEVKTFLSKLVQSDEVKKLQSF